MRPPSLMPMSWTYSPARVWYIAWKVPTMQLIGSDSEP